MRFRLDVLLFVAAALLMSACHSKKKYEFENKGTDAPAMSLTELYGQLADSYQPWTDVYMPVTLSLQSPTKMSISGRATMVRGQYIHFSLRVMGMEAAVVHIDADSVHIVDKYHKYYIAESLPGLIANYPIGIDDIQDMLLGQAFVPGVTEEKKSENIDLYYDSETPDVWVMEPVDTIKGIDWWCTATDSEPPMLSSISMLAESRAQVDCFYTEHGDTDAGIVASIVDIAAFTHAQGINAQVKWTLSNAKWNTGRNDEYRAPNGYKRLITKAIFENLKDF